MRLNFAELIYEVSAKFLETCPQTPVTLIGAVLLYLQSQTEGGIKMKEVKTPKKPLAIYYEMCIRDSTHSMNRLESQLNCVLFIRSNRGVTLTPAGELLYSRIASAAVQIQDCLLYTSRCV